MAEKLLRCAVYTRKSTEDGLEQEFNSLDAQYEACTAYAASQRHEGWVLVQDRYDDGGFSGGNMQRPGLQRLLGDIATGKVDVILVYKIDRLTRSLSDFARIVDVLDKANACFVSITQAFNTTTSMGRLTLNVLLSFAQFEREVTGERIRDKIAASKRKGIWMGGPVPLGYDVKDRKLVANEAEAALVRHIMQRYLVLSSVDELASDLNAQGYRTKLQQRASGPHRGGCMFRRGTLYHLLANRIYIGQLAHKGEHFAGEHQAIVPIDLWQAVQDKLKARASGSSRRLGARQASLLTGLVVDGENRAMTPSHATKGGRRYRYYVTRPDLAQQAQAWRVPAPDLEQLVCERLSALLDDQHFLCSLADGLQADAIQALLARGVMTAATLRSGSAHQRRELVGGMLARVEVRKAGIDLVLDRGKLAVLLGLQPDAAGADESLVISLPSTKVRRGHQIRLVIPAAEESKPQPKNCNTRLVKLLAEAMEARQLLFANRNEPLVGLAARHGRCRKRLARLAALSCLAPDIVTAIVEGRQPGSLTPDSLLGVDLPLSWVEQRRLLGFETAA